MNDRSIVIRSEDIDADYNIQNVAPNHYTGDTDLPANLGILDKPYTFNLDVDGRMNQAEEVVVVTGKRDFTIGPITVDHPRPFMIRGIRDLPSVPKMAPIGPRRSVNSG